MKKLFILFLLPGLLFAKQIPKKTPFMIGDLIKIKITNPTLTEPEILKAFQGYTLEKTQRVQDGYRIWFRSFEPGKKEIVLGSTKVRFEIASALKLFPKRKDIFDLSDAGTVTAPKEKSGPFPITYLYGLLILLAAGGLFFFIRWQLRQKKQAPLQPMEWLNIQLNHLPSDIRDAAFALTGTFKGYIDRKFKLKILGKTSSEIMAELEEKSLFESKQEAIKNWLKLLDGCKYAGNETSSGAIQEGESFLRNFARDEEALCSDS